MPARVKLDWKLLTFKASGVTGWISFKKAAHLDEDFILSERAVYVIRVRRPFSFRYEKNRHSPVAYIGKGRFQQRITSHIKSWIGHLSKRFPDLKIDVYYCEPRVRYHGTVCEGVEADLIGQFVAIYGRRPLRNLNTPKDPYDRIYVPDDLRVLNPGKGGGYEWSLSPLASSHFYRV